MKRKITLMLLVFFALGMQAQEYVLRVYQSTGSATTVKVADIDSMFFYNEGFVLSSKCPLDDYTDAFNVALTGSQMEYVLSAKDGATWAGMQSQLNAGAIKMYPMPAAGMVDYKNAAEATKGFFFNAEGAVCDSTAADCAFKLKANALGSTLSFDLTLRAYDIISESPLTANTTVTLRFAVGDASSVSIFTYNVNVLDAGTIVWNPSLIKSGEFTYDVKMQPTAGYDKVFFDLDSTEIATKLGYADAGALHAAIADSSVVIYGVNADGSLYDPDTHKLYTATNYGNWFDAQGNVCTWGATAAIAVETLSKKQPFSLDMTQYPNNCKAGDTFVVKQAFVKLSDKTQAVITYNISIVGK